VPRKTDGKAVGIGCLRHSKHVCAIKTASCS
jgi:hypothetical protein